jgi:hypothetical protein
MTEDGQVAPDTSTASVVVDHAYVPKNEPWSLCGHNGCNLSEAAHRDTTVEYKTPEEYRCPDCVMTNKYGCEHGRS